MKGFKTAFTLLLFLAVCSYKAQAAKGVNPPDPKEIYKYDLNSAGLNLSLFKLFTIQPEKKKTTPAIKSKDVNGNPAKKRQPVDVSPKNESRY